MNIPEGKFKAGDVVTLGGNIDTPAMTVEYYSPFDRKAHLVWFDAHNVLHRDIISDGLLELLDLDT